MYRIIIKNRGYYTSLNLSVCFYLIFFQLSIYITRIGWMFSRTIISCNIDDIVKIIIIKDSNGKVIVEEAEKMKAWETDISDLFNNDRPGLLRNANDMQLTGL